MRRRFTKTLVFQLPLSLAALACLLLAAGPWAIRGGSLPAPLFHFRLAISQALIGADVNEKDATLAMQSWREAVVNETGFIVDVHVGGTPQLVREIKEHQLDGFSLTMLEFLEVENYASPHLVMDEMNVKGGDDYLLLVHQDSAIRSPADLHRKTLMVFDNPKMCLAAMWLETLLSSSNLGAPRGPSVTPAVEFWRGAPQDFFARTVTSNKLSRVVLPVYFKQADACLVTRRAFATMCELNPQLGRKLRVIANSPRVLSTLMAFHKDCPAGQREKFQHALLQLHHTVAGQQALTLFESSPLVVTDFSVLRDTHEMVKAYQRAHLKNAASKK